MRAVAGLPLLSGLALLMAACGSSVPRQPPGEPPTPTSVSVAEPGGDAHDPHQAALMRELSSGWGMRNDKDDQLYVPLPDAENWKRVRFFPIDHFTGFRYGDDHHALSVVLLHDVVEGQPHNSKLCMRRFEAWARPQLKGYEVGFGPFAETKKEWQGQPIAVRYVDGYVDVGFSRRHFSAAWAAYAAYPDACLIYAVAVPWDDHEDLAKKVRNRWVDQGFQQVEPRTPRRPYRK
jgi:hypothetical protein